MHIVESQGNQATDNQVLHPGSRALFRHWETLRAERPCPNREELELGAVVEFVPDLLILERDHMRNSFRYRLAGTRVCELFGENLTSTNFLAGWDSFEADVINKHLLQTLANFQPALFRLRLTTDLRQQVAAEVLALPLRMKGSQRIQVLGGVFSFHPVRNLGHNAITGRELLAARTVWTEYQQALKPTAQNLPFRRDRRRKGLNAS
ncbi:MAG: PAS domain-containing protein [Hyphomicrobiales bacterium]